MKLNLWQSRLWARPTSELSFLCHLPRALSERMWGPRTKMSICYHASVQEGPPFFCVSHTGSWEDDYPSLGGVCSVSTAHASCGQLGGSQKQLGAAWGLSVFCFRLDCAFSRPLCLVCSCLSPYLNVFYVSFWLRSRCTSSWEHYPMSGVGALSQLYGWGIGHREVRWLTENRRVSKRQSCDLHWLPNQHS